MSGHIARQLKPEEEEILRKREELAALRAAVADLELDLVDLRSQLAVFEGRYLRQVGVLYAELDEWKARISELHAQLNPSVAAQRQAQEARDQARQTSAEAHGFAAKTSDLVSSPELKSCFREVAKRVHPDFARNSADLERRTRFMAEANRAYQAGDAEALQRILDEYQEGVDAVEGEGIGAELIRIIRQISLAKARVAAIEQELGVLHQSEIALLKKQAEEREQQGRDLLVELAISLREQIERAKKEYETLAKRDKTS